MRDFGASTGRLRTLSVGAKLLYTAFTISALIGLVVSWKLYAVGVADAGAAGYYAGAAASATPAAAPAASGGGPVLDLPDEATARRPIAEQMPERKLLEVTHFHLFSVPVYVLILAHLWILARIPAWLSAAGVVASIVTTALHLAAPWIVRGQPGLAWIMPVSGVAMLVTLGVVAIVPTVDMWLPRARAERG